jgi:hypothetical protein
MEPFFDLSIVIWFKQGLLLFPLCQETHESKAFLHVVPLFSMYIDYKIKSKYQPDWTVACLVNVPYHPTWFPGGGRFMIVFVVYGCVHTCIFNFSCRDYSFNILQTGE